MNEYNYYFPNRKLPILKNITIQYVFVDNDFAKFTILHISRIIPSQKKI